MPYRQEKKPQWYVRVPTRSGGSVAKSTRSIDRRTALRIERMLEQFKSGSRRSFMDLIDAVHDGRVQLLDLLEADDNNALEKLRHDLAEPIVEPNLIEEIPRWRKMKRDHVVDCTGDHYVTHVLSFVEMLATGAIAPVGETRFAATGDDEVFTRKDLLAGHFTARELTSRTLGDWLTDLPVEPPTKRKYHSAMKQFIDHLISRDLFGSDNPMAKVKAPADNKPRTLYLDTEDAFRLIRAFSDPMYAAFNAFMAGSGADVSAALLVRRRDVNTKKREVRAPGTKTHSRDRVVRVAEWAWPFLEALLNGLKPGDLVFSRIANRHAAHDVFFATIAPLAEKYSCYVGYTMRDHRHTYAVRAARVGTPLQIIADQLGHANTALVHKVYARFQPSSPERDRWEMEAAKEDAQLGITAEASKAIAAVHHLAFTPPPPFQRQTKIEWPSVEELLKMLETASAVAVAARLGVSETALRKHLKGRGVTKKPDGRRADVSGRPALQLVRDDPIGKKGRPSSRRKA